MSKEKVIIGIAGEMASGKGTVAKYLEQRHGAIYWSYSRIMRDVLDRLHIAQKRTALSDLSLALRAQFGEDIFAEVMKKDIEKHEHDLFVVEAVRRLPEIQELKELDAKVQFIYIETDVESRYNRLVERGENAGDALKSFDDFKKDHAHNTEQTIGPLKEYADHIIINDGTMDDLKKKIDKIVESLD